MLFRAIVKATVFVGLIGFSFTGWSDVQYLNVPSVKYIPEDNFDGGPSYLNIPLIKLDTAVGGFGRVLNPYNYVQSVEFDGNVVLINATSTQQTREGRVNDEYLDKGDVLLEIMSNDYVLFEEEEATIESRVIQLRVANTKVIYMVEVLCKTPGPDICGLEAYDANKVLKALYRAE